MTNVWWVFLDRRQSVIHSVSRLYHYYYFILCCIYFLLMSFWLWISSFPRLFISPLCVCLSVSLTEVFVWVTYLELLFLSSLLLLFLLLVRYNFFLRFSSCHLYVKSFSLPMRYFTSFDSGLIEIKWNENLRKYEFLNSSSNT